MKGRVVYPFSPMRIDETLHKIGETSFDLLDWSIAFEDVTRDIARERTNIQSEWLQRFCKAGITKK